MIEYLLSLSLLIVAVLIIRAVFRKTVSPRVIYALWLVVVIRMVIPVTLFEVGVTVPEFLKNEMHQALQTENNTDGQQIDNTLQNNGTQMPDPITRPIGNLQNQTPEIPTAPLTPTVPVTPETPSTSVQTQEKTFSLTPIQIVYLVWLVGAVIVAFWIIFITACYNRRLFKSREFYKNIHGTRVYISKSADVPCIAGLIPSIYITPETAKSESEELIITHEYFHLRHGDHIWSFVRALALIVFWWNPLVWISSVISKRDAELACDDSVSSGLDDKDRIKYANILIDTIPQKHIYSVGFGSAPMKERIVMLTSKRKKRYICLAFAVTLALSAVGCSFGSLNEKETGTDDTKTTNTVEDTSSEETTDEKKDTVDTVSSVFDDYINENADNSLVYEGYTVKYTVIGYDDGDVFDFHIHLPQISDRSAASKKWNTDIVNKYSEEFGEHLKKSAQGINDIYFADVTWQAITTGDVVTVYIINHRGALYTGGQGVAYDIYHYDTVNKKFLTTNEFLSYYAKGELEGCTLADILEVMNKTLCTSSDNGDAVPLQEKDIQGVIPSAFGNGKFDVVYQGYSVEARFAERVLFDDYSVHTSKDTDTDVMEIYTYRYLYKDIKNYEVCQCKTTDQPARYSLYMSSYEGKVGNNAVGYYVEDLILTEYIDFDIERSDDGEVYLYSDDAEPSQKIPFERYDN